MSKYVVIDFETTGFSGTKDEIIEIGAIKVIDDVIVDRLSVLVKASILLPTKIVEITHITDGMLAKSGVSKLEAAIMLDQFIDVDAIVMGYNVMFDISFLIPFLKTYIKPTYQLNQRIIDVLTMYRDLYPSPHKLTNAVEYFQIEEKNTHRALDDVISTWEVFKKIREAHVRSDELFINVIGYQPSFGYRQLKLDQLKLIPHQNGNKDIYISRKFQ
jgi:DNA polymerase III alpha subunit (gram-positive type)